MKKPIFSAALIAAFATSASHAAVTAYDPFLTGATPANGEYNVAQLTGQGPTVAGTTGNWLNGTTAVVSATGLDYTDANYLPESGGSVNVPAGTSFGRQGRILSSPFTDASTSTTYLSFLMRTPTALSGAYRAFELHDGGFDDAANRKFQLGFQDGDFNSAGTKYGYRLLNNIGGSLGTNDEGVNLFVAKFIFSDINNADSVTIWQNPSLTAGEDPTGGATESGFNMSFDRFTFAQFGNSGQTDWDEVRFGDTFTDVTGAVPEPSTGILVGLTGLALVIRRRRA